MAVTTSGIYMATWRDMVDATQLAVDLSLETNKIALFTDSVTPNFSTDTAYNVAPYDANECTGVIYVAGGIVLTTTVMSIESGALTWDAVDSVWGPGETIANVMFGMIYADALGGNNSIIGVDFVTAAEVTAGTLTVTWATPAAGGIFNISVA